MPNKINEKQNIQIARLEEKVEFSCGKIDTLSEKVDRILDNHLPHLETAVTKLDTNQRLILYVLGLMVTGMIGLFFK